MQQSQEKQDQLKIKQKRKALYVFRALLYKWIYKCLKSWFLEWKQTDWFPFYDPSYLQPDLGGF